MKVLLSIKPEFANKIFRGEKEYEFRRTIFKNPSIKTVLVYASAPVSKVIGEFEIESVITKDPAKLWQQTRKGAGIKKAYFEAYFSNKLLGHAIKIKSYTVYPEPLCLKTHFNTLPPQSFRYINS